MEYSKTYRELKPIYSEYLHSKDKEKFLRSHESDIIIFESNVTQFKKMGYDKIPSFKTLKSEYDTLASQCQELKAEYKKEKSQIAQYSSLKKNLEQFLAKDKHLTKQKKRDGLD